MQSTTSATSSDTRTVPSFCRNCTAYCPIMVTVENGRAVKVAGDFEAPAYDGYTCPKGRDIPAQHNHPQRPLHCLARKANGQLAPMPSDTLLDEVARRIQEITRRHGPRSVAVYYGTGNVTNPVGSAMARAWLNALGSDLIFSAMAIDKPAANISLAMHGHWHAGARSFESCEAWMIVGANPVIAKSNGAPMNNPGQRLKEAVERGMKLIVIDPRRTETARRATHHLQAKPGEDATLLAGIVHIIIAEGLYDSAFVQANAEGFDALAAAVAPYTPEHVAARAGIAVEQLLDAARSFGRARRSGVICATGASFSPHNNLTFYLSLCLNTLCGGWAAEGEDAPYPNVLLPAFQPRAQPYAPFPVFAKGTMPATGFRESASGMPTAALPDEILKGGDKGIKALICLSGNPILSWPDQRKTEAALKSLELLVVMDLHMTATAKLAHYFVPAPHQLETAASTSRVESLKYVGAARGFTIPWAQYTAKVVERPAGSDLLEDASFFYRLGQRMGLKLTLSNTFGYRGHIENPSATFPLDMTREPSNEEFVEMTCAGSRIPLAEVQKYPHGHVFENVAMKVAGREASCTARLQLADPMMIAELAQVRREAPPELQAHQTHLLISRRINQVMNSVGHHVAEPADKSGYTPAHLHSADFKPLGLAPGDVAMVRSRHGAIQVKLQADDSLRPGVISVIHGFGGLLQDAAKNPGRSVTQLVDMDEADSISGIPRMSAIPVAIEAMAGTA